MTAPAVASKRWHSRRGSSKFFASDSEKSRQTMIPRVLKELFIVAATGFAYAVCLYAASGENTDVPLFKFLLAASSIAFLATLLNRMLTGMSIVIMSVAFFGGVYAGVFFDIARSFLAGGPDRNLFPIEMLALTVFAMPGLIAGIGVAWIIKRIRSSARK
jgi:hypothetical protein